MSSAAAFIEALQRRLRLSAHRMQPPGEYPPGWQAWFASMAQHVGAITGASVDDVIGVFLARPLRTPPGRVAEMTRWQAFSTLWRQQWQPGEAEDRRLRWTAAIISLLVNLFFAGALVWLMYLRFMGIEKAPAGDDVVQVEFIGKGTPGEVGGGEGPAPVEATEPDQARREPAPAEVAEQSEPADASEVLPGAPVFAARPDVATPALEATPADVAERAIPEPAVAPPVAQPVAVSEPVPDQTQVFVLPPTRRQVVPREPSAREVTAKMPEVREIDIAAPVQPARVVVREPTFVAPELRAREPTMIERELTEPLRAPTTREVTTRPMAAPQLRSTVPQVRTRDVPTPRTAVATPSPATPSAAAVKPSAPRTAVPPAPAASAATAPSPTVAKPGGATTPTPAGAVPRATSSSAPAGPRPAVASPGMGPKATPTPGTWGTPSRGDDWGASTRNRPGAQRGQQPGLYNADGSVRLGEAPGSAAPGLPPGTVTEEIANLDRAGTWRKRRPNDYEPTALDKYWVPNETLLAEWVRRSIKRVAIPIPGTTKRVYCDVSILALGGACGIIDPNLNEQPAEARPPPAVPFKPHLQEDNGSVRPAPGG